MKPEQLNLGLSKWWPADGRLQSEELMQKLKKSGINWVETGVRQSPGNMSFKAHEKRLVKVIEKYRSFGIDVWSVHTPFGVEIDISNPLYAEAGIDLYSKIMETCALAGVDKVIIHGSSEPIPQESRQQRIECCINSLERLYRPDVKIALETLPRTCLGNSIDEMLYILRALDGKAGCCVDVNHFHRGNVVELIRAVKDYLITLHISDDDGLDEKHWLPGQGVLDWRGILNVLCEVDYKGIFMYEVMAKYTDPSGIRENFNSLIKNA